VCTLAATVLHNFASYAAALAGFTAAIVASDELGATGGANGDAFMLAVTRASEICIGIVCAGVVLAATDFGGARRRLATVLATLTRQITNGFVEELVTGARLALHARGSVLALSEVLDQHAPYFGAAAPA
jgi:uncharacterized membrane protein YccC